MAILKTGASVFLTGEPGSGKTHTINRYVAWLRDHGIEPALTASTGIAATHVSGMTVHSWSGIGIKSVLTPYDLDNISSNERVYKRLVKVKVLIIDEVSMLDARTLGMVDSVCRAVRRNHQPFGGMQVVLVGDFFQLPPVNREKEGSQFAFESDVWTKLQPTVCYLTEQYRQDDPRFLAVLSAIRSNDLHEVHLSTLEGRASSHQAAPKDIVKLFSHNFDVDRINDRELAVLAGDARAFAMETRGPEHLIASLQRGCLSPEKLCLKPGAAVMFTRNSPQGRFVNGTLGSVVGFGTETGFPIVKTLDGAKIEAEPMEWKIEDQGRPLASVKQVPLRLAWAMTIHKSQGMSLDAALMDLGAAFEYGQGYVALSRVRRLAGLFLLGLNRRALEVHPEILDQDRVFRAESLAAGDRAAERSDEERTAVEQAFILASGGKLAVEKKAKVSSVGAIRADFPKAYARWSEQEEQQLTDLFREGTPIKEIARQLERKRGGITSRLKKLGLLQAEEG
ncbi:MAG: PIF1 family DEAD/DEAH box helicase [Patescibacteria group bacterium]